MYNSMEEGVKTVQLVPCITSTLHSLLAILIPLGVELSNIQCLVNHFRDGFNLCAQLPLNLVQ